MADVGNYAEEIGNVPPYEPIKLSQGSRMKAKVRTCRAVASIFRSGGQWSERRRRKPKFWKNALKNETRPAHPQSTGFNLMVVWFIWGGSCPPCPPASYGHDVSSKNLWKGEKSESVVLTVINNKNRNLWFGWSFAPFFMQFLCTFCVFSIVIIRTNLLSTFRLCFGGGEEGSVSANTSW